jgi:hypothetical protein
MAATFAVRLYFSINEIRSETSNCGGNEIKHWQEIRHGEEAVHIHKA